MSVLCLNGQSLTSSVHRKVRTVRLRWIFFTHWPCRWFQSYWLLAKETLTFKMLSLIYRGRDHFTFWLQPQYPIKYAGGHSEVTFPKVQIATTGKMFWIALVCFCYTLHTAYWILGHTEHKFLKFQEKQNCQKENEDVTFQHTSIFYPLNMGKYFPTLLHRKF